MPVQFTDGRFHADTSSGAPLAGGRLYTYVSGTTTFKATYTDYTLGTPNTYVDDGTGQLYIALNSRGEAAVWLAADGAYTFVLKDSGGSTVWTSDGESGYLSDLISTASGKGDALVAVLAAGTGAQATTQHEVNARTVSIFDYMTVAEKADVTSNTGSLNASTWLQAAIDDLIANHGGAGTIEIEDGTYLLNSVASADSRPNGVLIPYDASYPYTRPYIRIIGKAKAVFKAGANNQYMIRVSRQNVEVSNIQVDRNGFTGVTFVGVVPEDRSQTTTRVNQSYFRSRGCGNTYKGDTVVRGPSVAYEFQPGPQVGGGDSGCFFPLIEDANFIDCGTLLLATQNVDHATHPNFLTRAMLIHPKVNNATAAVLDLDALGDMTVVAPEFELCATALKVSAITTYAKTVHVVGGYFEACTTDVDTAASSGIFLDMTNFSTAKVTGTGAANVAYRNAAGFRHVFDTIGATAQATVDSAGGWQLMSDPGNARTATVMRMGIDNTNALVLTPYLKASNVAPPESSPLHEMLNSDGSNPVLKLSSTHATTPRGLRMTFTAAAPNNTSQYFLFAEDNALSRCIIWSNGDLNNRNNIYGAISDRKLKDDIEPAPSYWNKFGGIEFVKFTLKASPGERQLGVIAQQVEQVAPGLVYEMPDLADVVIGEDEDGNPITEQRDTGTKTKGVKYSILAVMQGVVLQEAMRRIEALEAKLAERHQ